MGEGADDEVQSVARERLGTTLRDKWRLDALIGVGGMAAVYAGTHRNGMRGAVKVLHPGLAAHQATRQRFLREGYVANSIDHRGVVRVLDDDVDQGAVFLVMELLEGEDLESIRGSQLGKRLTLGAVVAIALQLLDVLTVAHEAGVVHRDLKPENLFVTSDGVVKVLDFGIARAGFAAGGPTTESGLTMGTPAFMPPEQAAGERDMIDARTDLWALGATMFTLLTGTLVHDEPSLQRMLVAAMTRPAPPIRLHMPELPEEVAAVIDRALAFDSEERFADASAMRKALEAASGAGAVWSETQLGGLVLDEDDSETFEQPSAFAATQAFGGAAPKTTWLAAGVVAVVTVALGLTWRVVSTSETGAGASSAPSPSPFDGRSEGPGSDGLSPATPAGEAEGASPASTPSSSASVAPTATTSASSVAGPSASVETKRPPSAPAPARRKKKPKPTDPYGKMY